MATNAIMGSPRKRARSPMASHLTPRSKQRRAVQAVPMPTLVSPSAHSPVLLDSDTDWPLYVFNPGSCTSVHVSPAQFVTVPKPNCIVLAFYDGDDDRHVRAASAVQGVHGTAVYAVSVTSPRDRNDLNVPILFDPRAALTHHARATHPLGGGRLPMPVLLVLDHQLRRRAFIPVGCGSQAVRPMMVDDVQSVLSDIIRYLNFEHSRDVYNESSRMMLDV
ncbi:hypothetical protein BZA70DRAFT_275249 [Myxozyma melibiosi]|uniref:Uncharacterized protein n=1 Tax=Myxozyma melibiosi TaxID=54550 RepID=A0ABR1FAJ2_9ASCO